MTEVTGRGPAKGDNPFKYSLAGDKGRIDVDCWNLKSSLGNTARQALSNGLNVGAAHDWLPSISSPHVAFFLFFFHHLTLISATPMCSRHPASFSASARRFDLITAASGATLAEPARCDSCEMSTS